MCQGGQSPPSREHLNRIAMERADIYRCIPPEGLRVSIIMMPAAVDDGLLEEANIDQSVRGLKGGRAGSLSGIQAYDLKRWLRETSLEKNPVRRQWWLLVKLIQRMLEDGVMTEEVTWETIVLLQKGRGDYRGIGLVGVV